MGEGKEPSLLSVSMAGNIVVAALVRGIYVERARELNVHMIMCQWYKGHQFRQKTLTISSGYVPDDDGIFSSW